MLQRIISDLLDKSATLDSGLSALSPAEIILLEGCCAAQAAACLAATAKQLPAEQQQQVDTLMTRAVQRLRGILAASKHGKLTGIAASSLGSVLNSALTAQSTRGGSSGSNLKGLQGRSTAQHAQRDAAQQVGLTESDIKVAQTDITAAVTRVAKLPSAALGKKGVALGLVALLWGSVVGGHAVPGALLDRPGWTHEAKSALQVSGAAFFYNVNTVVFKCSGHCCVLCQTEVLVKQIESQAAGLRLLSILLFPCCIADSAYICIYILFACCNDVYAHMYL